MKFNFSPKHYFITGLVVWLPMGITAWVLLWLFGLFDGIFLAIIGWVEAIFPELAGVSRRLAGIPGLGLLLVALLVFITGVFAANIVGQWWLRQWDRLIARIPVVRSIYNSVKQVSDTVLSGSGHAFSRALLVQYPRQGAWTIAFLTGRPGGEVAELLSGDYVSVYVPTTPNPTSGFFLMLPRADVVELQMSVDAALKYIISMGVVVPGGPQAMQVAARAAAVPAVVPPAAPPPV